MATQDGQINLMSFNKVIFIANLFSTFSTFINRYHIYIYTWRKEQWPNPVFLPGESQGQWAWWASIGLQRVGNEWSDLACTHTYTQIYEMYIIYIHTYKYNFLDYIILMFVASVWKCINFLVYSSVIWVFLVAQLVKNPPAVQEIPVRFLGKEDPLDLVTLLNSFYYLLLIMIIRW